MTGEEVICTKMITLCTDEELMKPEIPTIPGLMQIVHLYERSQASEGKWDKPQHANAEGKDEESAQALCTMHTLDTAIAVSPYLSYVHVRSLYVSIIRCELYE